MVMRFYVTTPIYYVNSTPTLGHAYTTIAADILTRHHRQRGDETYFLTGVDEHADKVARVAAEQGLEPQEYADRIVGAWQELPRRLNAVNDFFIRTSDEGHKRFVQDFLQRIYDNGDVYEDVYAGWYCVGCEAFKTEAELVDGKCPDHGTEPEWLEEKNWFFRLSAYQDRLLQLYDERPDFVLPSFRYNEARSFIAGGLRDFSISRATQTWGVPIPWDPEQVAYVWADALVNYRSALSYAPGREPRALLAGGAPAGEGHPALPLRLLAGAPALGGRGTAEAALRARVPELRQPQDVEVARQRHQPARARRRLRRRRRALLRCARATAFGQDGNVSVDDVRERYERELANDLGNLVSRTTAMIARYRDGAVEAVDAEAPWDADALRGASSSALDRYDITGGLEEIWLAVRRLNQYVEESAPWQLAKDEARADELTAVLYNLADGLTAIAVAVAPYLPESAPRILEALGQPADDLSLERVRRGTAVAADGIEPSPPLFPRVELPAVAG